MVRTAALILALSALAGDAYAQRTSYISLSTVTMDVVTGRCGGTGGGDVTLDPCGGYVLGISDALQLTGDTCRPPSEIATRQTIEVVKKYIADHPERWNVHPAALVRESLRRAFPCRPSR